MADKPAIHIEYLERCGDCGDKRVELPLPLPEIGDDFDWDVRDYDGYRLFMLEELAARFQERKSWTPADMEVVLVETLSVVLDQLSDMNDRIQAESFLQTARRPDTVRRLLELIGYQPYLHTDQKWLDKLTNNQYKVLDTDDSLTIKRKNNEQLETLWDYYPHLKEQAKIDGPRSIKQQHRMVTLEDYKLQLQSHPLVLDVAAYARWSGSWYSHYIVVRLINNLLLDDGLAIEDVITDMNDIDESFQRFKEELKDYYQQMELSDQPEIEGNTSRYLLQDVIQRQRMIGQEVVLRDASLVGILLSLSVRISKEFYRSQVSDEIKDVLISRSHGYFSPGNLSFGEDIVASNIVEIISNLDGVESVCINKLKRVSSIYPDQSGSGRIVLEGYEVAVLEDSEEYPGRGRLKIVVHGGIAG